LIIPRETTPMLSARADRPGPAAPPRQVAPATGPATTQPPDRGPAETKLVYRVKSGDTLFDIAKLFRISVESLKLWNHLRSDTINPGDRLTIFTKGLAPRA
jgi:LysM repeat protein